MNLRAIANRATASINPNIAATLRTSTGNTTASDGTQTPNYVSGAVTVQIQATGGRDLHQLDNLNVQGVMQTAYINGDMEGLVRIAQKGGDLLTVASGRYAGQWLVVVVMERWPDWVKVGLTQQLS